FGSACLAVGGYNSGHPSFSPLRPIIIAGLTGGQNRLALWLEILTLTLYLLIPSKTMAIRIAGQNQLAL
ncbi:MAG: hypothetical protein ACW974_02155, partial [Candidatus Thorarchaeota archaeon]